MTAAICSAPNYADEMDAFHRAHRSSLRKIIAELPLRSGDKVLDMACGDGVYSRWLSERVDNDGLVVAVDALQSYFAPAAQRLPGVLFAAGKLEQLPFVDASFDLVWCAQSLISLPDPLDALRRMGRLVRRGGIVAVLENDSLHSLILPWPVELELAIRQAELTAYQARCRQPAKRYLGRRLRALFQEAGLQPLRRKTYNTELMAPIAETEATFLASHLQRLREWVAPYLSPRQLREFDELTLPNSPRCMWRQPSFEMTWHDVVCWGQRPN